MENNNISMILCSCDSYNDTWEPFCKQLIKNWPSFNMPIYLCTESKEFSYPQLDIRCPLSHESIYTNWSKRLIKLLKKIDSEFVLFMLDDFWITEPVDTNAINRIKSYMENDKQMGFVCLKNEGGKKNKIPETSRRINCKYPELVQCLSREPFRITTQAGIWRRKYLIKILRSHESAWYFETRATWRSKFYKSKIYDIKRTAIKYPVGGFLWGGKCYNEYIHLYPKDITQESLNKRGTINFGTKREYPNIKKGISYYYSILLSMIPKW